MLEILSNLFEDLHYNSIPFCNWKGHCFADEHLKGNGDLDLFIPISKKMNLKIFLEILALKKLILFRQIMNSSITILV